MAKLKIVRFLVVLTVAGYGIKFFYDRIINDPMSGPDFQTNWPAELGTGDKPEKNLLAKNFYVIFDNSGSMAETRCAGNQTKAIVAKSAMHSFVQKIEPGANLGLLVFDQSGVRERVPLGSGPDNRQEFVKQIRESHSGGNTPLASAMKLGIEKLARQAGKQLGYGEYNLVMVTDGEASEGEKPGRVVQFVLKNTPVIIHTVGFCIDTNHSLNQPGRVLYRAANNPEELVKGLESVLAESEQFVADRF